MKTYRLVDINLGVACNVAAVKMTEAAALVANRDLLLQGYKNLGWVVGSRVDDNGKVK